MSVLKILILRLIKNWSCKKRNWHEEYIIIIINIIIFFLGVTLMKIIIICRFYQTNDSLFKDCGVFLTYYILNGIGGALYSKPYYLLRGLLVLLSPFPSTVTTVSFHHMALLCNFYPNSILYISGIFWYSYVLFKCWKIWDYIYACYSKTISWWVF
jgi:hypothetical protein